MLRLVTIPISHYCEKARWALDRAGIAYREERHVQLVHRLAARRAGGGRTVPVLVTPERVVAESDDIIRWVDDQLSPERRLLPAGEEQRAQVERLCRRFDERLGPASRRLIYVHVLEQRELVVRFNHRHGLPQWEALGLRLAWPLAVREMKRQLDIRPGAEVDDEDTVRAEMDAVAELLGDGRPFLCGERFTAADLTFAALAAAVLVPPEYGVALPQPADLDAATAALVERFRSHPAGAYALRLFADERH